jgi:transcriptional regulator with XRE-family HTH domain
MTATATFLDVLDFEKVRRLRIRRKLSMSQAAAAAGLRGRQRWYQIESGKQANLTIDTLNKVAAALGVRGKDLLK